MVVEYIDYAKKDIVERLRIATKQDYFSVLKEAKRQNSLTIEELQSRIIKIFMQLDREWFFDNNRQRFDKIKADFMQTNVVYNEQSKLVKHLTGVDKLEEAAKDIRSILS